MKFDLFQSCDHCWVFQICWHIECSNFTASSSRIWNSLTGIPSRPLALFVVMLSKAHLTSHSRMSGSREWSHHRDYLGREDLFCTVLLYKRKTFVLLAKEVFLVYSCHLFLISSSYQLFVILIENQCSRHWTRHLLYVLYLVSLIKPTQWHYDSHFTVSIECLSSLVKTWIMSCFYPALYSSVPFTVPSRE